MTSTAHLRLWAAAVAVAGAAALAGSGVAVGDRSSPPAIQNGGTLVVGMGGDPGSLDPVRGGQAEIHRTFCESLYDSDSQGRSVPLLASGPATFSKDKLTLTIPLRKGILFNDGTPFNAEAAAATFERDITTPGSARAGVLGGVTSATASGPYTVQLHLSAPNTALGFGLVNERMVSPTQVAKLGSSFATDPVCVGPFMFDSQVAGQSVTLVRSPYYYDKQDVHLDKLVFKRVSGGDFGAAAALESGDVQALDKVPKDVLRSIEQHGFRVLGGLGFAYDFIGINLGNANGYTKPYSNPGTPIASSPVLREAFEMAIDRTTLNRVVFGGLNVPGCTLISPAAADWYEPKIPCTPYDPVQARKLVQQSGIPNPTVQMIYPGSETGNVLAEFLQAEEQAVGINLVLTPEDSTTQGNDVTAGHYQTYINAVGPVKADPDWINVTFPPINSWGYANPRLALVLDNARKAVSPQARHTLYRVAQQIIMTDRPVIVLFHTLIRAAFSNRLTGFRVHPDGNFRVAFAGYTAT